MILRLQELRRRNDAITEAVGKAMEEAAVVLLEHYRHNAGVKLRLLGSIDETFGVVWDPANANAAAAWHDHEVAAEWGASGVAVSIAQALFGLRVVNRARKKRHGDNASGGGFDYYLSRTQRDVSGFQEADVRLEVSGIGRPGRVSAINRRLAQKLKRYQSYNNLSSAQFMAIVIEFVQPTGKISTLNGTNKALA